MLRGREAQSSDAFDLSLFTCAEEGEPEALRVQEWVRDVLHWKREGADRHVIVFHEDDGCLIGVIAYKPFEEGGPPHEYFVYLMAVTVSARRNPDQHYGTFMMNGLVQTLSYISPGGTIVWMVESSNHACNAFCYVQLKIEPSSPPEHPGFLEYQLTLPTPPDPEPQP